MASTTGSACSNPARDFWSAQRRSAGPPSGNSVETDDQSNEFGFVRRHSLGIPQGPVAEIACGSALLIAPTRNLGGFPVALDNSREALHYAHLHGQMLGRERPVCCTDAARLPFANEVARREYRGCMAWLVLHGDGGRAVAFPWFLS